MRMDSGLRRRRLSVFKYFIIKKKKNYNVLKFLFFFLPLFFDVFLCKSQIVLALVSEYLKCIFICCSCDKYFGFI